VQPKRIVHDAPSWGTEVSMGSAVSMGSGRGARGESFALFAYGSGRACAWDGRLMPIGPLALQAPSESATMAPPDPADKDLPETERRPSESRSCVGCAASLQGRRPQAKYCSDRCRVGFARRARLGALKDLLSRLDSSIAESTCIRADLDHLIGVDEVSSRSRRPSSPSVSPGHQGRARVGAEPE
jgi:hypothetical protein